MIHYTISLFQLTGIAKPLDFTLTSNVQMVVRRRAIKEED